LGAKRALLARQRYVVTRLHLRGTAAAPLSDLRLAAAKAHQSGGYGVPRGPNAELAPGVHPAAASRYQVRFHAAHPWQGALPCTKPERWRWGKRWKSHTQHWRGVDVARDLLRLGQDPKLLDQLLLSSVPEIGFAPRAASVQLSEPATDGERPMPDPSTCGMTRGYPGASGGLTLWLVAGLVRWRRRSVRVGTGTESAG
ncbi:MAG TPA: hypothetical protein VFU02_17375, partial [Polyangiaceae bacterium]|nr:hypothetical protein [Polyangiaceae bacterium]